MSESQTLKTMIHEVAHSMLHNKEMEQDEQARKDFLNNGQGMTYQKNVQKDIYR